MVGPEQGASASAGHEALLRRHAAAQLSQRITAALAWDDTREADVVLLAARATAHTMAATQTDYSDIMSQQLDRLWNLRVTTSAAKPGWGLSYAWDSYNKGSPNAADTVYSYTTAAAALAFLDGYAVLRDDLYLQMAAAACSTLLTETCCWREGPFLSVWYSNQLGDHRPEYQTHNVNALALAAMSRVDRYTGCSQFGDERDAITAHLISEQGRNLGSRRLVEGTAPVAPSNWRYRRGDPRPNDLLHECFIIEGLLEDSRTAARRSALAALEGVWETHFGGEGIPRQGRYTRGSLGWGPGAGLFALASASPFMQQSALLATALSGCVGDDGLVDIAPWDQPRAQAWYGLGLARFALRRGSNEDLLLS